MHRCSSLAPRKSMCHLSKILLRPAAMLPESLIESLKSPSWWTNLSKTVAALVDNMTTLLQALKLHLTKTELLRCSAVRCNQPPCKGTLKKLSSSGDLPVTRPLIKLMEVWKLSKLSSAQFQSNHLSQRFLIKWSKLSSAIFTNSAMWTGLTLMILKIKTVVTSQC